MIEQLLEWVKSLHQTDTFQQWLSVGGIYVVTGIIFAETGLLFGFFLPGDSLLITTGVLCNPANPNHVVGLSISAFMASLTLAAIIGDQLGYYLGKKTGNAIYARPDGRFFKRQYLDRAHAFYAKYGVVAIIACRFVPIMRTFVPFVAGMARMPYAKFASWDILGGAVWINSLLIAGYYLGQTEMANRLDKIILIVIFVSVLPMVIGAAAKLIRKPQNGGNHS
jgi:membrane-associated protein